MCKHPFRDDFGEARRALFPPQTLGGQNFAAITAAIDEIDAVNALLVSGRGSVRERIAQRLAARQELLTGLDAVSDTATAIALDTPGIDARFKMPASEADLVVLDTARAFARDARPLADRFVAHHMKPDFVERLEEKTAALARAISDLQADREANIAANDRFDAAMQSGMEAVRRLSAIVPNALEGDDAAIQAWERASRVAYPRGNSRKSASASAAPAPAAASGEAAAT